VFFEELARNFLLPPMLFLFLTLLGLGVSLMWKKLGSLVAACSTIALLLCSIPAVTAMLMSGLQNEPALSDQNLQKSLKDVDALVLLGGGKRSYTAEFNKDTASEFTLERIRYAAWIAKRTGLPLIVSGGKLGKEGRSIAEMMQEILQKEFIVIVDHIESASRNTYENAQYTVEILKENKMKKIALVTHAWHMPRARKAFEHFEIEVVPAPTAFYGQPSTLRLSDFIPSVNALLYSSLAFHEMIGQFWYELRYY